MGVNRLSIGAQSFNQVILSGMVEIIPLVTRYRL